FASTVRLLGPVGSGERAKIVNNVLVCAMRALSAEALAFGEALGLDRETLLDTLLASSSGFAGMRTLGSGYFTEGRPQPFWTLFRKDVGLASEAAKEVGFHLDKLLPPAEGAIASYFA